MTLSVSNAGSKAASTSCRVTEARNPTGGLGELVQTPVVPAGESITFTASLAAFGDVPRALAVECQSP
jgi:hypothetical protein